MWSQGLLRVEPIRRKNPDGSFRVRIVAPDGGCTPLHKPGPATIEVEDAILWHPLRMEDLDDLVEQVGEVERIGHQGPNLRKPEKPLLKLELGRG
jgi:hypothetical protein